MKSSIVKRSVLIAGHKTSVSLEDAFWKSLKEIASDSKATLAGLVASIDDQKRHGNLSSAIRLFVLSHYQARTNRHDNGDEQLRAARTEEIRGAATHTQHPGSIGTTTQRVESDSAGGGTAGCRSTAAR